MARPPRSMVQVPDGTNLVERESIFQVFTSHVQNKLRILTFAQGQDTRTAALVAWYHCWWLEDTT